MASLQSRRISNPNPNPQSSFLPTSNTINNTSIASTTTNGRLHTQQIDSSASSTPQTTTNEAEGEEYLTGSVVRIRLKNFLTYDDCEIFPGPHLNVVIGPNGTGKSSIVCALALGLAGKTDLLGRARKISDYIKFGQTRAFIEIELYRKNHPFIVRRDISMDDTSEWRINGKRSSQAEVKQKLETLGVQVDNMCHFLPQDKVSEFSELASKPSELLLETEKAVKSHYPLYESHQKLIELHEELAKLKNSGKEQKKHLEDLKAKNELLKRDVLRYQEREKALEKVRLLQRKKPWVEFEMKRQEAVTLKDEKQKSSEKLKEHEERCRPLQEKILKLESEIEHYEKLRRDNLEKLKKIDKDRNDLGEKLERLEQEYEGKMDDIKNLQVRAQERKKEVEKLQHEVNDLKKQSLAAKNELETCESAWKEASERSEQVQHQLQELQGKKIDIQRNLQRYQTEYNAKQSRMKQLDDLKQQRLEALRRHSRDAYDGWVWLQKNKNLFEKEVFGPVCIEVIIENPLHAQYLEQCVPSWLLTAFVCQTEADNRKLREELYDKQNLQIKTTYATSWDPIKRTTDISKLQVYGLSNWLDEVVKAPQAVIVALRNMGGIDVTAIGNEHTDQKISDLLEVAPINNIFTPSSHYTRVRSKYGNRSSSTRVLSLRQARFIGKSGAEEQASLQAEMEQIMNEKKRFEADLQKILEQERSVQQIANQAKQRRDLMNQQKSKCSSLQRMISVKERNLTELLEEEDTSTEERKLRHAASEITKKRVKVALEMKNLMEKLTSIALEQDLISLGKISVTRARDSIKSEHYSNARIASELKHEVERMEALYKRIVEDVKNLRNKAQSLSPLTDETKQAFELLPNTIHELEEAILTAQTQADVIYQNNPTVMIDFEKRKTEIAQLESKLGDQSYQISKIESEMQSLKTEWYSELKIVIKTISDQFEDFFKRIKCVGKVILVEDEDFKKYKLEIQVKFRTEQRISTLDFKVQSGGERSVATMLFLLALHSIAKSPFRLVDEINQGMDPQNETAIFSLLQEVASRNNCPQYFLITPKLLPNLQFSERMTLLCIFNGPWNEWAGKLDS